MPVQQQMREGVWVVRPIGRLDAAGAPELPGCAVDAGESGATQVVLDLGAVTQVTSHGLDAILALQQSLARQGIHLAIAGANEGVQATLRTSGLLSLCPYFDGLDRALADLA